MRMRQGITMTLVAAAALLGSSAAAGAAVQQPPHVTPHKAAGAGHDRWTEFIWLPRGDRLLGIRAPMFINVGQTNDSPHHATVYIACLDHKGPSGGWVLTPWKKKRYSKRDCALAAGKNGDLGGGYGNGPFYAIPADFTLGAAIHVYRYAKSGEPGVWFPTEGYCGGNHVTATCPLADHALDRSIVHYANSLVQIAWTEEHLIGATSFCVGDPAGAGLGFGLQNCYEN